MTQARALADAFVSRHACYTSSNSVVRSDCPLKRASPAGGSGTFLLGSVLLRAGGVQEDVAHDRGGALGGVAGNAVDGLADHAGAEVLAAVEDRQPTLHPDPADPRRVELAGGSAPLVGAVVPRGDRGALQFV